MSKHSESISDFYATPPETAEWLVEEVRARYDTHQKVAMEPCVGGWVFPDVGVEMSWRTNDLNIWSGRKPDTVKDFLTNDFPACDFIISNPPFGPKNKLAVNFISKSLEVAPVVAMVVPSVIAVIDKRMHNALPLDTKLVFSKPCPVQEFELPDGTKRHVRTHGVIFERVPGYVRKAPKPIIKDHRRDLIDFCDDGKFVIRTYGDGIGDVQPWREGLSGTWARFNTHGKQCAVLKLLTTFPWRFLYGNCGQNRAPWGNLAPKTPTISSGQITHHVNCMGVLEGRLEPKEGLDYNEFLEEFTRKTLFGLKVH